MSWIFDKRVLSLICIILVVIVTINTLNTRWIPVPDDVTETQLAKVLAQLNVPRTAVRTDPPQQGPEQKGPGDWGKQAVCGIKALVGNAPWNAIILALEVAESQAGGGVFQVITNTFSKGMVVKPYMASGQQMVQVGIWSGHSYKIETMPRKVFMEAGVTSASTGRNQYLKRFGTDTWKQTEWGNRRPKQVRNNVYREMSLGETAANCN